MQNYSAFGICILLVDIQCLTDNCGLCGYLFGYLIAFCKNTVSVSRSPVQHLKASVTLPTAWNQHNEVQPEFRSGMRTSLRTIPSPDAFSRQATSVISLGQVRSGPQTTNDYVESPRAQALHSLKPQLAVVGGGGGGINSPGFAHRVILPSRGGTGGNTGSPRQTLTTSSSPIVSQQLLPKSPPLKKEPVVSLDASRGGDGAECANGSVATAGAKHGEGIICDECGKCRCAACTEPRPLPSHWCCHDSCEISPDKVLDVCTCFCCVKGMFYHCGAEEDNECYEKPCGCCSTPHCCRRWTVLSMMAVCLPCLWAYWPVKACLAACTSCYNRCRHKGCQCSVEHKKGTSMISGGGNSDNGCVSGGGGGSGLEGQSKNSQTRRLLIESDSSSA